MTPDRWQQIEELFEAAIEREPDQRAAFLDQACAHDPFLRRAVESLILSDEQAGSFIEAPALEATTELRVEDHTEPVEGRRIGPYQLKREIGQGGMGTVYLAERADQQYRKRVAIKLVKRGMDTDFIVRRFRHERQILASLDHPNIARLLEGGTTEDGQPYFVMEYIEGQPLDQYCDRHTLSTVERLKLFRTVCSAVHYAHQNLVVHRDLKPSNILVTADGVPKLLDFGIAKLLNPELSPEMIPSTVPGLRAMTPEYASPEQLRGEPITTASDVYSMGVVLYELLTGHRPYRFQSLQPQEIMRVVCEEEPEKPSTAISREEEVLSSDGTIRRLTPELVSRMREGLPEKRRRRLKGDLDNIVLMAMRKEPPRRYTSVEQFSGDIRRHLDGLPVIARQDTLGYRAGKFIKRHTVGVAAATLIVLTLLAGIVATAWEARVARSQQAKAERRFNDVRKLANSLLFQLHDEIADLHGSTQAREHLVKMALEYLDSLAREAGGDQSLQSELAAAYVKVGDVQGNPYNPNLGDTAGALASHRKALAMREALVTADPTNTEKRRDLAISCDKIGYLLKLTGDLAGALASHRKALAIEEALAAADPTNLRARRDLSVTYNKIGYVLEETGDLAGALENYRKALAIDEHLAAVDPTNARTRRDVELDYSAIGKTLAKSEDTTGALENLRKALAISQALSEADPTNAPIRRDLWVNYIYLGRALAATGDTTGALDSLRKAWAIAEATAAADSTNTRAREDIGVSYSETADMLAKANDTAKALEHYRKALAIFVALSSADPTNAHIRSYLAETYANMSDLQAKTGDTAGALESDRKVVAFREALSAADLSSQKARRDVAESYSKLGHIYTVLASATKNAVGKRNEYWNHARSWYQKSLDIWLDLRHQGKLSGSDADQPGKITAEIAKCDVALAKVGHK